MLLAQDGERFGPFLALHPIRQNVTIVLDGVGIEEKFAFSTVG